MEGTECLSLPGGNCRPPPPPRLEAVFQSLEIWNRRVRPDLSEIRHQQPPGPVQAMDMFYLISRVLKRVSFLNVEEASTARKMNHSTASSSAALTASGGRHARDTLVPNTVFYLGGNCSDSL